MEKSELSESDRTEDIEETMLRRMAVLARQGDVRTLVRYTDAYYGTQVREAAVRGLGKIPTRESAEALSRLAPLADDAIRDAVTDAVSEVCERMDIGPLGMAAYMSHRRTMLPPGVKPDAVSGG